jgi:SecD/SecF fusion protein
MPRWLFIILVAVVGLILLVVASVVVLPRLSRSFLPDVGVVLIYEMEGLKPTQDPMATAAETVKALDRRLNPGIRWQRGTVRAIEGNRIEVGIYGSDPKAVRDVTEIVENVGTLEFRIVANVHKHQSEIEAAKADPDKNEFFDSNGEWIARWVRFRESEKFNPQYNLVRARNVDGKPISEVLIVRDPYDVTGDFLANIRPGHDCGKPIVEFTFNARGAKLFSTLTGDNVPDGNSEMKNQMAIVLNGVLYSAPNILTTISDRGQITGNFTEREVSQIVNVLNAGSLPVHLRKIEERKVETR